MQSNLAGPSGNVRSDPAAAVADAPNQRNRCRTVAQYDGRTGDRTHLHTAVLFDHTYCFLQRTVSPYTQLILPLSEQADSVAHPNYSPDLRGMGGQKDGEFLLKTCGPGGADMVWCYGTPDPIY